MKVTCELRIYEINGVDAPIGAEVPDSCIRVHRHWNCVDRFVVLEIEGKKYTVGVRDLRQAIKSCAE